MADDDDIGNAIRIAKSGASTVDSPAQKMMSEYKDDTWNHPWDNRSRLLNTKTGLDPGEDFAQISMSPSGSDSVHVHEIHALEKGRGQGSQALNYLKNLADKHSVTMEGVAKQIGSRGLKTKDLKSWYKRHGFSVNRSGEMIRKPQKG
jgi:hypothetical protein